MYRPEQIEVGLDDVVGIDVVKEEVVRTLQLFLDHERFAERMGGRARRGILFQGGPGTGKTLTAKAMAAEAGVPFLFASGTSFHSSYQGATQRKVRKYFKALRKLARRRAAPSASSTSSTASAVPARGMTRFAPARARATVCCGGLEGLRDAGVGCRRPSTRASTTPTRGRATCRWPSTSCSCRCSASTSPAAARRPSAGSSTRSTCCCRSPIRSRRRRCRRPTCCSSPSTNRADGLDPALLRPGRFDRALTFELPSKNGRRAAGRPLPEQASRTRPELDDGRAPRRPRRHHVGLQPGHDRGAARRGAGQRRTPRRGDDDLGRRRARPARRARSASASRSTTPSTSAG